MPFVIDFWIITFFILWIGCCLLSCKGVCYFVVEVIVIEGVAVLGVCHKGCVV